MKQKNQQDQKDQNQLKEKIINNPASKIRISIRNAERAVREFSDDLEARSKKEDQRLLYI